MYKSFKLPNASDKDSSADFYPRSVGLRGITSCPARDLLEASLPSSFVGSPFAGAT